MGDRRGRDTSKVYNYLQTGGVVNHRSIGLGLNIEYLNIYSVYTLWITQKSSSYFANVLIC